METQVGRKPPLPLSQPSIFYYRENILQLCAGVDSCQHAGTHLRSFTSLSWKGATIPCSRLPASPRREIQPPALVYQPLLEGSYYPLLSFTGLSWKGATTPCSCLPATTGRELQPAHWRLRPSAPLQTTFHQFSYWIQKLPQNTPCRPLFIIFSDWTHSTHLSSIIHQTDTYNFINSFNEPSTNQSTTWSFIKIINNIIIIQTTQICMNTSLTDSSKPAEHIRHFIP